MAKTENLDYNIFGLQFLLDIADKLRITHSDEIFRKTLFRRFFYSRVSSEFGGVDSAVKNLLMGSASVQGVFYCYQEVSSKLSFGAASLSEAPISVN